MLEVTERAKQELMKTLKANTDNPEACMRLTLDHHGSIGFRIDTEKQGDQVVEYENSKLLVVEKDVLESLPGLTLDIEESPDGNRFVFP